MRKKCITKTGSLLLLVAILAACLLSGCSGAHSGIDQTVLTQEQREAITAAYAESKVGAYPLYWFQTDGLGAYYLGEIEGCIIFYNLRTWNSSRNENLEYGDPTDLWRPERMRPLKFTIADVTFSPGFQNQLCTYRDGEVLLLSRAYFKEWISQEGVEQVKTAYDSFVRYLLEMGESEYVKHENKFDMMMLEQGGFPADHPDYTMIMQRSSSQEYPLFLQALKGQGG